MIYSIYSILFHRYTFYIENKENSKIIDFTLTDTKHDYW